MKKNFLLGLFLLIIGIVSSSIIFLIVGIVIFLTINKNGWKKIGQFITDMNNIKSMKEYFKILFR
jgi:hypothetical protein